MLEHRREKMTPPSGKNTSFLVNYIDPQTLVLDDAPLFRSSSDAFVAIFRTVTLFIMSHPVLHSDKTQKFRI